MVRIAFSTILKYKYGMNPLTTTWPPILYTDYGYKNFLNWLNIGGFDNVMFRLTVNNEKVNKTFNNKSTYPFQTFILGQKNLAPKIAKNFNINLIFSQEPQAEDEIQLRDQRLFNENEYSLLKIK